MNKEIRQSVNENENQGIQQQPTSKLVKEMVSRIPDGNPEKMAKMIAKTFYIEMTRYGFSCNQIITVASEIVGCLNNELKKHEEPCDADAGKRD